MLSYKVYILLYSLLIFLISHRILRFEHLSSKKTNSITCSNNRKGVYGVLFLAIILVIIPKMLRVVLFGIYQEPDYYVYEKDSDFILGVGRISFEKLSEDVYYRTFPIYTLINVIVRLITSLTYYEATLYLNFYSLTLFTLLVSMLLVIRMSFKSFAVREIIFAPLLLYSNTYLYALWGVFAPVNLGQIAILLALYLFLRLNFSERKIQYDICLFITYTFMLVHISVPVYLFILLVSSLSYIRNRFQKESSKSWISAYGIIPVIIFALYATYQDIALKSLIDRVSIFSVYYNLLLEGSLVYSEAVHPYPAVNALGPAFPIGITAAFFVKVAYSHFKGHHGTDLRCIHIRLLFSIITVSLVMIFLPELLYFVPRSEGNVTMYPRMYGFFLNYLGALGVMLYVPLRNLNASSHFGDKLPLIIFLLILVLSATGGLLDPFAFNL